MTILSKKQEVKQARPSLMEAAIWYARMGLRVHPLKDAGTEKGKEPRLPAWQDKASSDVSEVTLWWTMYPNANIGIATGGVDGVDVLDLDGEEAQRLFDECPDTPYVKTSNGRHVYFAADGLRNGVDVHPMLNGVDLRGEGGYVVAPPSIHPDGTMYEWAVSPSKKRFAPLPMWVKALNSKQRDVPVEFQIRALPQDAPEVPDLQKDAYARRAIDGILSDMRNAVEGGRNHTLNELAFRAGRLIAGGAIDADAIVGELAQAAMDVGLPAHEVRATLKSGIEAGQKQPYYPDYKTNEQSIALPSASRSLNPLVSQNRDDSLNAQTDWMERIQRNKPLKDGTPGTVKTNAYNLGLVLRNDPRFAFKFRFNELTQRVEIIEDSGEWRDIRDADYFHAAEAISEVYGMTSAPDTIATAINAIATSENSINPPAEYLNALKWDGEDRLDRVPSEILGAEDKPEYRNMFRWWLMAAVQRAMSPGCKADSMLVLSGRAGIGKTTFFMELGFNMWAHSTSMMLDSKDFMQEVIGSWIVVFDEMSAFKKADHENAKAFITKTNDVFRAPYGRTMQTYPRRAIFAGTTNENEFARESSGMRRFWPMECGTTADHIDIDKLIGWRDQMWAEAFVRVQRGEKAYASTPEECKALEVLQSEIVISDAWQPAIVAWVQARSVSEINNGFTISECLEGALKIEPGMQQHGAKCRAGLILRDCFKATSKRIGAKKVTKYFLPIETIADDEVLRQRFGREEVLRLINASNLPLTRFSAEARVWLGLDGKTLPEAKPEPQNDQFEEYEYPYM